MGVAWKLTRLLILPVFLVVWFTAFKPVMEIRQPVEGVEAVEDLIDLSDRRLTDIERRLARMEKAILEIRLSLRRGGDDPQGSNSK